MERLVKGDIVILPFPYTDFSETKRRPALVVAAIEGDDVILCQITGQEPPDQYSIKLSNSDLKTGSLHKPSEIRTNKIMTAFKPKILYKMGSLKESKMIEVENALVKIFKK